MKSNYSRFNEFFCVLFGHTFDAHGKKIDDETGITVTRFDECSYCGIRVVDESGYLRLSEYNRMKDYVNAYKIESLLNQESKL